MGGDAGLRGLRVPEVVLEDLAVTGSHGQTDAVVMEVNTGERILRLESHHGLPGGRVTADQFLVQTHREQQVGVDGTEGDVLGGRQVGAETEDVLVGVAVPEREDSALTAGGQERRLEVRKVNGRSKTPSNKVAIAS